MHVKKQFHLHYHLIRNLFFVLYLMFHLCAFGKNENCAKMVEHSYFAESCFHHHAGFLSIPQNYNKLSKPQIITRVKNAPFYIFALL